jgi:hypothetical protein
MDVLVVEVPMKLSGAAVFVVTVMVDESPCLPIESTATMVTMYSVNGVKLENIRVVLGGDTVAGPPPPVMVSL